MTGEQGAGKPRDLACSPVLINSDARSRRGGARRKTIRTGVPFLTSSISCEGDPSCPAPDAPPHAAQTAHNADHTPAHAPHAPWPPPALQGTPLSDLILQFRCSFADGALPAGERGAQSMRSATPTTATRSLMRTPSGSRNVSALGSSCATPR